MAKVSDEERDVEEGFEDSEAEGADSEPVEQLPLFAAVTGLLFVSPRPLPVRVIASATGVRVDDVKPVLEEIRLYFREEEHGFTLVEVSGGWQFRSSPRLTPVVRKVFAPKRRRISRAAAETLAVIAYKQPIQRAEIEAIRGVDALPTLKTLLDQRLIRIVGKENSPGHPTLYGTTQSFLERFGLRDLSDLPSVKEIERLAGESGDATGESESEADDGEDDLLEPSAFSDEPIEEETETRY